MKTIIRTDPVEELVDSVYGKGFYASHRGLRVIKTHNSLLAYKEVVSDGIKTIRIYFTVEEKQKDIRNSFLFLLNLAVARGASMLYFGGKDAKHIKEFYNWFDNASQFKWMQPNEFECKECVAEGKKTCEKKKKKRP